MWIETEGNAFECSRDANIRCVKVHQKVAGESIDNIKGFKRPVENTQYILFLNE